MLKQGILSIFISYIKRTAFTKVIDHEKMFKKIVKNCEIEDW